MILAEIFVSQLSGAWHNSDLSLAHAHMRPKLDSREENRESRGCFYRVHLAQRLANIQMKLVFCEGSCYDC